MSVRVEPEAFRGRVSQILGDAISESEVRHGQVWLSVGKNQVVDVLSTLKTDPQIACDYFTFLSAIDWKEEGFEVMIALYSTIHLNTVGLKIRLEKASPHIPSVTSVYRGANWHERECAEMFGITFEGHPNPKRLYLADDFVGHPLLKDFKLASREYKQWPGDRDPGATEGGDE